MGCRRLLLVNSPQGLYRRLDPTLLVGKTYKKGSTGVTNNLNLIRLIEQKKVPIYHSIPFPCKISPTVNVKGTLS